MKLDFCMCYRLWLSLFFTARPIFAERKKKDDYVFFPPPPLFLFLSFFFKKSLLIFYIFFFAYFFSATLTFIYQICVLVESIVCKPFLFVYLFFFICANKD
jgi:hypothetical protein